MPRVTVTAPETSFSKQPCFSSIFVVSGDTTAVAEGSRGPNLPTGTGIDNPRFAGLMVAMEEGRAPAAAQRGPPDGPA